MAQLASAGAWLYIAFSSSAGKLLVAALLGIVLGLERELKRKPLGLKTCVVMAVASCLLTVISIESASRFWHSGLSTNMPDPMRLAAQVIAGVGFLGAGVIFRKQNDSVTNLTTAAIVWASSGLGIAAGAGFYKEAAIGLALIIFSVEIIPKVAAKLGPKALREQEMSIKVILDKKDKMRAILAGIEQKGLHIEHVKIEDVNESEYRLELFVCVSKIKTTVDVYDRIKRIAPEAKIVVERIS